MTINRMIMIRIMGSTCRAILGNSPLEKQLAFQISPSPHKEKYPTMHPYHSKAKQIFSRSWMTLGLLRMWI
ncbi:Uncharacterized protein TCM_030303 [Theobroma cacao]|uniref:Uncharacterized protein n=1 Tax=Theobroma cacao TaxID=3641 RepID=A0A061GHD0_THECC|nr:Uncharacterized protein TCM_030303 [Theobroma cacao]